MAIHGTQEKQRTLVAYKLGSANHYVGKTIGNIRRCIHSLAKIVLHLRISPASHFL